MYPVHSKNWNCSDSGVQFQLGGGGLREPHLKTHARDTSLLPGGAGGVVWGGLGVSVPEIFGNLEAWKWYFQCSLKRLNLDMV